MDADAEEGPRLVAGQILGHYRVIRLIGKAGMASSTMRRT